MPQLSSAADTKYQLQLPKVSFRVVEDGKSLTLPAGVHSVRPYFAVLATVRRAEVDDVAE